MKVTVTIELDVDLSAIDSRGEEEWAVFDAVADHIKKSSNADDFYGTGANIDYVVHRNQP